MVSSGSAIGLGVGVGEVVGGGEAEFGLSGCRRPRVGRGSEARRAGLGARRRRLLEVGESARLGAIGGSISLHLLVAGEAEGVSPEIERHGELSVFAVV